MGADASQFGPVVKKVFASIIGDKLIPEYVEKNRKGLEREITSSQPGRAVDGLVAIYKKIGNNDYDWKRYGPARDKIKWDYLTFDPAEKKIWEPRHRFRKVTVPAGSENWVNPGFDPKAAGWKTGHAPFANIDGKLAPFGDCKGANHICGCGETPNTFWDKEALLMRANLELPPLKDGYAYRLLVGGRSHYNAGGGTDVWFDGDYLKPFRQGLATIPAGSGRNSHRPWGVIIQDDYRKHFDDGKLLLGCNGFLRWGHKIDYIKCYKTLWFEEMKLPPLPEPKK
jgi:hypothetical protein